MWISFCRLFDKVFFLPQTSMVFWFLGVQRASVRLRDASKCSVCV